MAYITRPTILRRHTGSVARCGMATVQGVAIIAVLAGVVLVPYLLRPEDEQLPANAARLVIVSPHNEAIRFEFEHAFSAWHEEHFGVPVDIDWRAIGGTSEIARYIGSSYLASFKHYWTQTLNKPWTAEVEHACQNRKLDFDDPNVSEQAKQARRTYVDLSTPIGIGIDIFFGGGQYDHHKQGSIGNTAPAGIRDEYNALYDLPLLDAPEDSTTLPLIDPDLIPIMVSGEYLYDKNDRYYGACLTAFGISYNTDVVSHMANEYEQTITPPVQWRDLADPVWYRQLGLADPTKSGSATKCFEMLLQQQIWRALSVRGITSENLSQMPEDEIHQGVVQGFQRGMQMIQKIGANARYFTDSASKVPIDISLGNSAAGMVIDFYAKFQAQTVSKPDGSSRMQFVAPEGGTSISADPISLMRSASNETIAKRFIGFVLSVDGQKLWNYRVGAPGGPVKYALRRLPIRKDFYGADSPHPQYMIDAKPSPYELAEDFTYNYRWTASLFGHIRLYIRTMCIDTADELRSAWGAIIAAGGPHAAAEAYATFTAQPVTYDQMLAIPLGKDPIADTELAMEWMNFFRTQYQRAEELARQSMVR